MQLNESSIYLSLAALYEAITEHYSQYLFGKGDSKRSV